LTGFKPTQDSVPLDGAYPLSLALDSIGPIARSVADCELMHSVLSGAPHAPVEFASQPRLAVPANYVRADTDASVSAAFDRALLVLERAGFLLERITVPGFDRFAEIARIGSFPGIEAFAAQKHRLADKDAPFDPRVRQRIEAGGRLPADALPRLRALRAEVSASVGATLKAYDAFLYPTVPTVAPTIAELADDDAFGRINLLMLRNPTVMNVIDGCAVSLPIHPSGTAPVGLSVAGLSGTDRRILAIARRIEQLIKQQETS
jgi:aspartyl-tRNA(Asn)/glutamyl-tRNA(Gln) amidotransferase subunit A